MNVHAVHQVIPVLAPRDAIGNHTMQLRSLLRSMGLESDIHTPVAVGERAADGLGLDRFRGGPGVVVIYQCSTGSPLAAWCMERTEPVVIDYHNITPAAFFDPWEPHVGVELRLGRSQLAGLSPRIALGLGDSAYNTAELEALGARRTAVAPILSDLADFDGSPDRAAVERLQQAKTDGGADWLFVGRIAPHKAQHRLVAALAFHRQVTGRPDRLHLVGGAASGRYASTLRQMIDELELRESVRMTESISFPELLAHYATADVFVSASEHEGFCVPLLEAMHLGVPIVALAAAAVPETMGGAGVLVSESSPGHLSTAVTRVLADPALRAAMVRAGRVRVSELSLDQTRARMRSALEPVISA